MRLSYLVKTCAMHFKRAWMSSLLSVFTIMFLLVLLGFFGLLWINLQQLVHSLSSQVQIHAYLSDGLAESQIEPLRVRLQQVAGVARITYVSKADAAAAFQLEFGKELFSVMDENPLPASFVIDVLEAYRTETGIRGVAERIQAEPGVEEAVSHYKTLQLLNRYADAASRINLFLLLFVAAGSLLLVTNNIRLVIGSQKERIDTMRLVGATASFIRTPLIVEGVVQGLLGGVLALLVLHWIYSMIGGLLSGFHLQGLEKGGLLIAAGGVLGLLGGCIGIKRYL